jgi:hypothetical protein
MATIGNWIKLAGRISVCAESIFLTGNLSSAASEKPTPKILSACLLSRSISTSKCALDVLGSGYLVEARILVRAVLENTFYMVALAEDGDSFADKMYEDEIWSQQARGKELFAQEQAREAMTEEIHSRLRGYLRSLKGLNADPSSLGPKAVIQRRDISGAYVFYQQLSSDAAHPSLTSLGRHITDTPTGDLKSVVLTPPPHIDQVRESARCISAWRC